ncbi:TonB-dependent receptor [Fulvivirgaceae bacterium BMA10]|uniref:TonB-dependent receptor n=1 Tax=Splendidivirga corallicola TaxID=3051826 RepID=A0ABT8KNZ1_9BACT|nr:TonB-dependent receptor [Fulvivirgaceae bacterium BMA10]
MKLMVVFLMLTFLDVTANTAYTQNTKLTLSIEKQSFRKILKTIRKKSEFNFVFESNVLREIPEMSIDVVDATITDILDELIVPHGLEYEIDDRTIIIRKAGNFLNQPVELRSIQGKITDQSGDPVFGASVVIKGTTRGVVTDANGSFSIEANTGDELVVSYVGYITETIAITDSQDNYTIVLKQSVESLGTVYVVGSRNENRSEIDTPVPIDVIDIAGIAETTGKVEINQILQYAAPSFNATKQSGSDGADHIDPASLRGLGPDQTLVLINGKRRHQSSLVNVFGTRGRGNSGTDLNAIPAAAIKRIEVLRDGASAQYGSDAIAGVINIVLKDKTDEINGSITYGAYSTAIGEGYEEEYGDALFNIEGKQRIDGEEKSFDGNTVKVDLNYGINIGSNGGFANFTTEYLTKDRTLRPGFSWRKGYGSAAVDGFNFIVNSAVPIDENTEIYAFGGRNFRDTDAYAFSRSSFADGDNRSVPSLYPNGFTPRITSNITDVSASAGIRHTLSNGWRVDFNNTYGKNNFHYFIKGSNNASLGDASPTVFDAGGHSLAQNTTGLDFSKYYDEIGSGFNLAFGLEFRTENFTIFAGEEASYAIYDQNGIAITNPANQTPAVDSNNDPLPGGSQGFPGYSPANEVDRNRTNLGMYVDAEINPSAAWLIGGALRYENYSDFGETFNFKLASRYKINEYLSFRGSVSSGFRAPSLTQIHYNLLFNNIVAGTSLRTLLASNTSTVTKAFGIGPLQEETAFNGSLGFTLNVGDFSATVDAYSISVDDRIILTDNFDATSLGVGAEAAQFFANGVDTKTTGLDIVLNYKLMLGADDDHILFGIAGNVNDTEIENINNRNLNVYTFFGPFSQAYLEAAAPDYKFVFNAGYAGSKFDAMISATLFSEVILQDFQWVDSPATNSAEANALLAVATDTYEGAATIDVSLSYSMTENLKLTVGGNNIFNTYPTPQFDGWTDQGGFNDSVQMGSDGAYFFGRIGFNF